jgi:hypothetical protein
MSLTITDVGSKREIDERRHLAAVQLYSLGIPGDNCNGLLM